MFDVFSVTAEPPSLRHSSDTAAWNCTCSTLLTGFSSFRQAGGLTGEKILNEFSGLDYIPSLKACVSQWQHFSGINNFSY